MVMGNARRGGRAGCRFAVLQSAHRGTDAGRHTDQAALWGPGDRGAASEVVRAVGGGRAGCPGGALVRRLSPGSDVDPESARPYRARLGSSRPGVRAGPVVLRLQAPASAHRDHVRDGRRLSGLRGLRGWVRRDRGAALGTRQPDHGRVGPRALGLSGCRIPGAGRVAVLAREVPPTVERHVRGAGDIRLHGRSGTNPRPTGYDPCHARRGRRSALGCAPQPRRTGDGRAGGGRSGWNPRCAVLSVVGPTFPGRAQRALPRGLVHRHEPEVYAARLRVGRPGARALPLRDARRS